MFEVFIQPKEALYFKKCLIIYLYNFIGALVSYFILKIKLHRTNYYTILGSNSNQNKAETKQLFDSIDRTIELRIKLAE